MSNFNYFTDYNKLVFMEYGRNVQRLVEFALTIPNRTVRNRFAHDIVSLMGQLNPHLRNIDDFKHKLWDHLIIISDYQLDIDSPYPYPEREVVNRRPQVIPYPQTKIRFKQYGKNIDILVQRALNTDNPIKRSGFVQAIVGYMKTILRNRGMNNDLITEELLRNDLLLLSDGLLDIAIENATNNHTTYRKKNYPSNKFHQKQHK